MIMATQHRSVNLDDAEGVAGAVEWWAGLTGKGGEGMVVKPKDFISPGRKGLVHRPSMPGPDTCASFTGRNTTRRKTWSACAAAALEEAVARAQGVRAGAGGAAPLHRREPLRRVHEAVFAILALESEPLQPRLEPSHDVCFSNAEYTDRIFLQVAQGGKS